MYVRQDVGRLMLLSGAELLELIVILKSLSASLEWFGSLPYHHHPPGHTDIRAISSSTHAPG
jgi:hypothetical protein